MAAHCRLAQDAIRTNVQLKDSVPPPVSDGNELSVYLD